MHVNCPHCHNGIEVVEEASLTDVECPSCGSQFSLLGEDPADDLNKTLPGGHTTKTIGRFELVNEVGKGAFGSVWRGKDPQLDRTVAVKIPRKGQLNKGESEQFFREARAAAQLKHPNIVPVHEIGKDGETIYIVSDFVQGISLAGWLTAKTMGMRESAELCVKVCRALQHAHEKGVIHRDLKPANIMLDDQGEPHVMDFGLAKREAGEITMTVDGQVLGTPAYMSPEQARGSAHDADGRSDLYSVGVILFELLTGELPFRGNIRMLLHQVINDEAPSPIKLNSNIDRDLATITTKCMEKDPDKRYSSADELANDLQRFLDGKPIIARPISNLERGWRWCKRKPALSGALALSTLLLTALAIGGPTVAWQQAALKKKADDSAQEANAERGKAVQAREAESIALEKETEQRKLAEEAKAAALMAAEKERTAKEQAQQRLVQIEKSNEILGRIFEDLDIQTVKAGTEPLEAVLAKRLVAAGEQLEGESIGDPLAVATLQDRLGRSLNSLGFARDAIELYQHATNTRKSELGSDHLETLNSMSGLAAAYHAAGELDKSLSLNEQLLEISITKLGADHPDTLTSMDGLAQSYHSVGELNKALPLYEQALELRKSKLGSDHTDTLNSMNNLAFAYKTAGELDKALPLYVQTLEKSKSILGPDHAKTLNSMNNLAQAYRAAGKLKKALPLLEKTLEMGKTSLGTDHPQTLTSMNNLALAYDDDGEMEKALPLYKTTLDLRTAKLGNDHPETLTSMNNLASAYQAAGELKKALPLLEQTLELRKAKLGADHPDTLHSMNNLAVGHHAAGASDKALPLFEQTLKMRKAELGSDHHDTLKSMNNLAFSYYVAGEFAKALPLLEQTLEMSKAKLGADHPNTLASMNGLAAAYQSAGELDKALPLHEQTLQMMQAKLGADHPYTLSSMNNLASAYQAADEFEKAFPLFEQTLAMSKAKLGTDHPNTLSIMNNLADAYGKAGILEKSVPLFEETLKRKKQKLGDQHPDTLLTMANLGSNYLDAGRIDEAIAALEEVAIMIPKVSTLTWARGRLRQAYVTGKRREKFAKMAEEDLKKTRDLIASGSLVLADELASLGDDWLTIGDPVAAEPLLRECLEIRQQQIPEEWRAFNAQSLLGTSLVGQEKWDDAQPLLEAGYAGLKATAAAIPAAHRRKILTDALDNLIALATATSDAEGLKKWTALRATYEPDNPTQPETAASTDADKK